MSNTIVHTAVHIGLVISENMLFHFTASIIVVCVDVAILNLFSHYLLRQALFQQQLSFCWLTDTADQYVSSLKFKAFLRQPVATSFKDAGTTGFVARTCRTGLRIPPQTFRVVQGCFHLFVVI